MIIWIASYPKSGNTWIRSFLGTYLYSSDGQFNHNLMHKIHEFPDSQILKKYMDIKNFHNLAEVSKHWIKVQSFINAFDLYNYSKDDHIFLKTHSSMCNINGNNFTSAKNTIAVIHVVRDPRNVILSMSNHFGTSQEKNFKTITNERNTVYSKVNYQLIPATFIGSWNFHYLSWKNFNSINKVIIRYEDLINNTEDTFKKIINFLSKLTKIKYNEEKLVHSVNSTQFKKLQKYEEKYGFRMGQKNKFFYLGKENNWKNLLNPEIEKKTREAFLKEIKELEYI